MTGLTRALTFTSTPHAARITMIQLTRLNNQPLMVNSDLIKFVERAPDTVLTLVSGEKIVVLEAPDQVLDRVVEFRRTILAGPLLTTSAPQNSQSEKGASDGQE
jgi:flagellar protein FlbD